jgi:endonuclease/exonuclease/phosphatase family metal-dependent hydrolase
VSSSSEGDEEENKNISPDMTHSSRRPPLLFPHPSGGKGKGVEAVSGADPRITTNHASHVVIAAPYAVVPYHHYVKVYVLPTPSPMVHVHHGANYTAPEPVFTIDTRTFGMKDPPKVISAEFRHTCLSQDRGRILWLGTKEGHLFEVDIRTGKISGMRLSAHPSQITHIWRRRTFMVTADDSGKVLVFNCANPKDGSEVKLTQSSPPPKVVRVNDKAEFMQLCGGLLWTSSRADMQSPHNSHRNALLRVYDIFSPGYQVFSVLPKSPAGFVTGAAELEGGRVYLSHEQGSVSVWSVNTEPAEEPQCTDVFKCGTSDLTSCVGVCGKLWVGARSGLIHVFDVSSSPWVLTNSWYAHNKDLPVVRITTDLTLGNSTEPNKQRWNGLGVASLGRDDVMRFWDGTLAEEWVGSELFKREAEFSKLRKIKILTVSWNCDSARPEDLHGSAANITLLQDILTSVDSPDIIYFGFQEVVDLESRSIAAKNVFMGSNKRSNDSAASYTYSASVDEGVTRAYRRWHDHLYSAVRLAMPADCPYEVMFSESLVGLFTCMFIKTKERVLLKDVGAGFVKRGMGGRYGNKGGILARFVIEDTSICLVNCHLAAGQTHVRQRNSDAASFLDHKELFPVANHNLAYSAGGDGTMVLDHEFVFFHGDLNYRIDQRREAAIALIQKGEWEGLTNHDQLLKEMKYNRGFRLKSFSEGPLRFAPTYKYDRRSNTFDSSEKKRCPAWCDRILWRACVPERVTQLHYQRYEADVSDHRPISAAFELTVKSLRHEIRQVVKEEILLKWAEEQKRLLEAEKKFYSDSGLAVL